MIAKTHKTCSSMQLMKDGLHTFKTVACELFKMGWIIHEYYTGRQRIFIVQQFKHSAKSKLKYNFIS